MKDNGGRRYGFERRQSSITINFPDRRSGDERRCISDRRSGFERRSPEGLRAIIGTDRRSSFISA